VLEGELSFHVDGPDPPGRQGDTVFVPRGTPQAFRVDSSSARLLVLDTAAGHERFFRAMGEPTSETELPPAPPHHPTWPA
jgi:quercetin dioxygenase-like cupin family protein